MIAFTWAFWHVEKRVERSFGCAGRRSGVRGGFSLPAGTSARGLARESAQSRGAAALPRGKRCGESLAGVAHSLSGGLLVTGDLFAGSARPPCATQRCGHHESVAALWGMVSVDEPAAHEPFGPTTTAKRLRPARRGESGGCHPRAGAGTDRFEVGAALLRGGKFLSL